MDKLIYTAMSGAHQSMLAQAIYANNLANVDTPGFRADYANATAAMLKGGQYHSRALVSSDAAGSVFSPGVVSATDRDLDVSINGDGWFSVLDSSGQEAYTRSGNWSVEDSGALKTQTGYQIMGSAGPIVLPAHQKIEFAVDGQISVRPLGANPNALVQVDRLKLVNDETGDLVKGADGLFRPKNNNTLSLDPNIRVTAGALEGSNVNAIESLLSIVNLSRQFEMQMKEITQAADLDEASNRLLRLS